MPVVSLVAPAPVSVLQLVRCNCETSKCSRRFSCRGNNVVCTELPVCKCGGEGDNCANITQPKLIGEDLDDWSKVSSTSNVDTPNACMQHCFTFETPLDVQVI